MPTNGPSSSSGELFQLGRSGHRESEIINHVNYNPEGSVIGEHRLYVLSIPKNSACLCTGRSTKRCGGVPPTKENSG